MRNVPHAFSSEIKLRNIIKIYTLFSFAHRLLRCCEKEFFRLRFVGIFSIEREGKMCRVASIVGRFRRMDFLLVDNSDWLNWITLNFAKRCQVMWSDAQIKLFLQNNRNLVILEMLFYLIFFMSRMTRFRSFCKNNLISASLHITWNLFVKLPAIRALHGWHIVKFIIHQVNCKYLSKDQILSDKTHTTRRLINFCNDSSKELSDIKNIFRIIQNFLINSQFLKFFMDCY